MAISARNKGARGEREVVDVLSDIFAEVCEELREDSGISVMPPKLLRNSFQSAQGGEDIAGLPWYSVEVKRCERLELGKWWVQTTRQANVAEFSKSIAAAVRSTLRLELTSQTSNLPDEIAHRTSVAKYVSSEVYANLWSLSGACGAAEKKPILFYRQNNRPWTCVLFGFLRAADGTEIRTPVDVSFETFRGWLKLDFRSQLADSLIRHPSFEGSPPDFIARIQGDIPPHPLEAKPAFATGRSGSKQPPKPRVVPGAFPAQSFADAPWLAK